MENNDQNIKFIMDMLKYALSQNASDVFISADFPPALKVDGKVVPLASQMLSAQKAKELVLSIMNPQQREAFHQTKEANFAINPPGLGRFRVSAFVQKGLAGMVLRKISMQIPKIEDLGLPPILKDIALIRRGLVIFVGGAGTGKSTSLAALLDWRNSQENDHIITLEDPIEYVHQSKRSLIMQREIGIDTESWNIGLKNALRQASDVILMGEVRDSETMRYALQFSGTGNLCLCTLHANSANQGLDRVVNFFPEERRQQTLIDLAMNTRAIVSQRLVPHRSGSGRVAAVEVLLNTPLISDMIGKGDFLNLKEAMERSRDQGMQTFDQSLFDLYEANQIGYEDALRHADSINDLRLRIKLHSQQHRIAGVQAADSNHHLGIL